MTDKIKREARERMAATGESYTAARRAVARQAATALADDGPPQLNRDPADATSAMLTMGFGQLMAAGARARAFPTVYPGGAGAVVREAVTSLWSQVIPGAVADVLCACVEMIVSQGKSADILDGWGSCPVAAAMLRTATWTAGGRWAAARTWVDTEPEADVLLGTWVLLALAHQRSDEDLAADAEGGEDDDWDATCDECGGELWGKGTYGCECWNPAACEECGDGNGDCDCHDF
jgi:hypothetical protein